MVKKIETDSICPRRRRGAFVSYRIYPKEEIVAPTIGYTKYCIEIDGIGYPYLESSYGGIFSTDDWDFTW